jgi:phosphinothricin acetyltransferase
VTAEFEIRDAVDGDLEELNDVYNHYVRETHITFEVELVTFEARRAWFRHYAPTGRHRLLVAVEPHRLLGYATSSPYHARAAYETSVETSIYLAPDVTGRGIGPALYETLLDALVDEDVHRAYGGVALPNPASINLHERVGFTKVAHFTEQGRKFGQYWDVVWYERPIGDDHPT